jgi:hypothetical protein
MVFVAEAVEALLPHLQVMVEQQAVEAVEIKHPQLLQMPQQILVQAAAGLLQLHQQLLAVMVDQALLD